MPKDTSDVTQMGASVSITAVRKARKASTLSEMWITKSSPSKLVIQCSYDLYLIIDISRTVGLAARQKSTAAEASLSTSAGRGEKRELSQATVVTEAILNNLEYDTMGDSWLAALEAEFQKPYFIQVSLLVDCGFLLPLTFHVKLKKFLLSECTSNTVFPKSMLS